MDPFHLAVCRYLKLNPVAESFRLDDLCTDTEFYPGFLHCLFKFERNFLILFRQEMRKHFNHSHICSIRTIDCRKFHPDSACPYYKIGFGTSLSSNASRDEITCFPSIVKPERKRLRAPV